MSTYLEPLAKKKLCQLIQQNPTVKTKLNIHKKCIRNIKYKNTIAEKVKSKGKIPE